MNYRKIAIVLLGLLIILSGCSSNAPKDIEEAAKDQEVADLLTEQKLNQQSEKKDDSESVDSSIDMIISENEEGRTGESILENDKGQTGGVTTRGTDEDISEKDKEEAVEELDEEDNTVELIPMKELPKLTMEPQTPFTLDEYVYLGTHMLTPVFHETFRYQIIEFTEHPARLVIDIGNTGDEPLVITDENFYFSIMDREGNDIAGSKVQGAPVTIAPGEIKRVVVTAENPDAGLVFLEFGGVSYTLGNPIFFAVMDDALGVDDTAPYYKYGYTIDDEEGNPYLIAMHANEVIGNGRTKLVGCGLMAVENEKIGPVEKGEGFLAVVRVRIANTSDQIMTIDKILAGTVEYSIDLTEEDLAVLGDKALPFTIEPYSIVEGWVPFRITNGRNNHCVVFFTSHGGFMLENLQAYPNVPIFQGRYH